MTTYLVSVVMTVYNGERFLSEAIDSILAQTLSDFELIVVDDGSTDETNAIMRRLADRDARVRLISLKHGGIVTAANEGISQSRGEFIARMDADDIADPDRLRQQVTHLTQNLDCVACGTAFYMLEDGKKRAVLDLKPRYSFEVGRRERIWVCHPTLMARAEAVRSIGGYRRQLELAEDADLYQRLLRLGHIDNLPNLLLIYRIHPKQVSSVYLETQRLLGNVADTLGSSQEQINDLPPEPLTPESIAELVQTVPAITAARLCLDLASHYLTTGPDPKAARNWIARAHRFDPSLVRDSAARQSLFNSRNVYRATGKRGLAAMLAIRDAISDPAFYFRRLKNRFTGGAIVK